MAWNRASEDGRAVSTKPPLRRGRRPSPTAWGIAAVVVGAAVAAWWLWPEGETRQDAASTKKQGLIKEVKPAAAPKAAEEKPKEKDPHEGFHLTSNGVWQPDGRPSRPGRKKVHGIFTNRVGRARSIARNGVEQLMLQIFSREPGDMPLPFPRDIPKADMDRLVEILLDKHPADEKDSETVKFDKETLQLAKKEMIKFIKDGGEPYDFLKYYHDQLSQSYFRRHDAQVLASNMINEGEDPAVIDAFIKKANAKLREDGIKEIAIPPAIYGKNDESEQEEQEENHE